MHKIPVDDEGPPGDVVLGFFSLVPPFFPRSKSLHIMYNIIQVNRYYMPAYINRAIMNSTCNN